MGYYLIAIELANIKKTNKQKKPITDGNMGVNCLSFSWKAI